MSKYVFDSSAVIAVLRSEPGSSAAETLIADAAAEVSISAVNWCEIVTKLARDGADDVTIVALLDSLQAKIVPFDEAQALNAGQIQKITRPFGLSLGDRACLALAKQTRSCGAGRACAAG